MLTEHLYQSGRAALVSFHPRAERFDAPQDQPSIERRAGNSQRINDVTHSFGSLFVTSDYATSDYVGMTVQILRRRVDDHVDAVFERPL